jgi:hypothetical protein
MKTITVSFSKWRSILILFISLLYLFIALFWIFLGWAFLLLVIPIVFFLGWNVRKTWRELTGEKPALILDKDGIVDQTHWYSLGRVGWKEIDFVKTKQFFIVQEIQIVFKDPKALIQKEEKFLKQFAQRMQLLVKKTPMLLNSRVLAIPHHELATLLKKIDFENPEFVDMSEHLID